MDAPATLLSLVTFRLGGERELCDAGREAALLFEAHRAPVTRYLHSFGLASQDCDEIVQETFISLFLHLRDGKPQENLASWIFRVAHNLGLKARGRSATNRLVALDATVAERQVDPHPDAEKQILRDERRQRLRSVVSALAEQDRQCLFLRAEGLRYREIAEVLGVSVGTVSAMLARALEKLRRADGAGA